MLTNIYWKMDWFRIYKCYAFCLENQKAYNRDLKLYRFKDVKGYEDDIGRYSLVNRRDVWPIDMVGIN